MCAICVFFLVPQPTRMNICICLCAVDRNLVLIKSTARTVSRLWSGNRQKLQSAKHKVRGGVFGVYVCIFVFFFCQFIFGLITYSLCDPFVGASSDNSTIMFWHCCVCGFAFPSLRGVSEHILRTDCKEKTGGGAARAPRVNESYPGLETKATIIPEQQPRHGRTSMILTLKTKKSISKTARKPPPLPLTIGHGSDAHQENGNRARLNHGDGGGDGDDDQAQVDQSIASVTASSNPGTGVVPCPRPTYK